METNDIQKLNAIVELAGHVLHMLYACGGIFGGVMLYFFRQEKRIRIAQDLAKEAKATAVRAHLRDDKQDTRIDKVYEIIGVKSEPSSH